jgi:hypothetical protein
MSTSSVVLISISMHYTPEKAAEMLVVKPEAIRRAIYLGAIVLDSDGLISHDELSGFAAEGFKHHRYGPDGKKLPGAKG